MKRTKIDEVEKFIGKSVVILGFIQTIRDQGKIKFLMVRDISGIIQIVFVDKKLLKKILKLKTESVVEIIGIAKKEKQALGGFEIEAKEIKILSTPIEELPIPVVEKNQEQTNIQQRLDWRWLDLRKPKKALIFKVWTKMEQSFREYWTKEGYIEIHSPKFMSTPSESGAELFEVKYFERKAYLAQSPQFYKQMAMASGLEKVFEVGPVFRANPSFTSRHDTEFTGYDAEISFIESHQNVITKLENIIQYALKKVQENFSEEIHKYYGRKVVVPNLPFPQITMKEAKRILSKLGVTNEREGDLSPEEEIKLCQYMKEKTNHEFLFVTEYPTTVRPFYHMRKKDDKTLTKSFDLLWNGIEITTGAQREHRYDILLAQAKEKGLNPESIKYYFNFFKFGCPPHGGFGLGPSRMLMKLFNITNVREVTYLYRGVKRLEP